MVVYDHGRALAELIVTYKVAAPLTVNEGPRQDGECVREAGLGMSGRARKRERESEEGETGREKREKVRDSVRGEKCFPLRFVSGPLE